MHTVSLAEAREAARECRQLLLTGVDPLDARRAKRMQTALHAASGLTFKECAEKYIAAHEAGWRNDKHRAQWKSTLASYVYPVIGGLSVAAIDVALVLKCIEPIWVMKPETAARIRGRLESVLDWATARGHRQGDNPARWKGHLDKLLPPRSKVAKVRHHAALPYVDVPAFMAELRDRDGTGARALEFTVLTSVRTGEAIGAKWGEVDLGAKVWTVPPERMKSGREHRVPLSTRAVELLEGLPRSGEYTFPGRRTEQPLSNMAMAELLKEMGTGGDPITARFMLNNVTDAMRRRLAIVPFVHKPPSPNVELEAKLRDEWPGILRWMIEGCITWQKKGLVLPEAVQAATNTYFAEQDLFGQWVSQSLEPIPTGVAPRGTPSARLFRSWSEFAHAAGEEPGAQRTFGEAMSQRGYSRMYDSAGLTLYAGVRLKKQNRDSV